MNTQFSKANIYNDVKMVDFPRHEFDQSYTNSFTMNHGLAVPSLVDIVKPGDLIDVHSYGRAQLTPLATSSMQNIRFYTRYFYVPFRLLWKKWDEFISQDGFVETPLLAPYVTLTGTQANAFMTSDKDLFDYLNVNLLNIDGRGNPIAYSNSARISFTIFPFLAYQLIWDTYFRDENMQQPVFDIEKVQSGLNDSSLIGNSLLPVAKEKDYFTTALPWTQKGQPVTLGSSIQFPDQQIKWLAYDLENNNQIRDVKYNPFVTAGALSPSSELPDGTFSRYSSIPNDLDVVQTSDGDGNVIPSLRGRIDGGRIYTDNSSDLVQNRTYQMSPYVGLEQNIASSFNINELRYANALQRYLERLALGGNRPAEFYLSMYGVQVDDLRIGQPKYLGGGSSYIHVTSIPQTSESANTPQGTLAGNGQASLDTRFNEPYYCQEFGILMAISYIRPELNYSQGLPRIYQLFEHLDYYNPIFAHLGEEEVRKSELMIKPDFMNEPSKPELNNDEVFGFQSRYAYLKGKRNEIHGELKTSLRDWMLTERYILPPTLNNTFIVQPQNYDIFAITEGAHHYIVEMRHDYQMVSNMPDFAIPSL